jgi:ProP effector
MKSMNTMSPVAQFPEANENAAHATPDAAPGTGDLASAATDTGEAAAPVADEVATDEVATKVDAAAAPTGAPAAAAGADIQSPRALLKLLQQDFPAFRNCLPLAIGIDKQVVARLPGVNRKIMRAALGIHVGSMRYLRAMEKATVRYDLDGNAGVEVSDTHRQHAKELLQERFKKEAERKKAERDAAVQEEAERKRQEKLQQLATKFSKH